MIVLFKNKENYFIPYFIKDNFVNSNTGKLFNNYCNVKRIISKIFFNKKNNLEHKVQLNYIGKIIIYT